ncbi:hypothetical protein V6N13_020053 [Hibiscus sabdariffa]|uniref:Morc S5 domain-containing protein n=1 Tax=Hibiscus sabdariffa TaxID=183260 RepID=A0ABR2ESC8_9ROSI
MVTIFKFVATASSKMIVEEVLGKFNLMKDHGTRIIIYNLWEDDQRLLEFDFHAYQHDIQLRGVNRDEKNIQMTREFSKAPFSRDFPTPVSKLKCCRRFFIGFKL